LQPPPKNIKNYIDTRSTGFAENAFKDYTELESVYAPHAEVIGAHAFDGCSKMTSWQLGNVNEVGDYAFNGCAGLLEFEAFKWAKYPCALTNYNSCGVSSFANCVNLEKVDFNWFDGFIPDKCFSGCSNLKALILRADLVVSLFNIDAFDGTPIANGTGYVYVQSKNIDSYPITDKWPTYANQFRVLEDYTVDGTVDGELDETKI
jgi:hypothetical protein